MKRKIRKKGKRQLACMLAFALGMSICSFTGPGVISALEEPAQEGEETPGMPEEIPACTINGTGEGVEVLNSSVTYNGKTLDLGKFPLVKYQGVVMAAFSPVLHGQGPKVDYSYNPKTKRVYLVRENKVVTLHMGESTYYTAGKKKTFSVLPTVATYTATGKSYKIVPFEQLCTALGMTVSYQAENDTYAIEGKKVTFSGSKVKTKYAYSMKTFAKKEYQVAKKASYATYLKLVDPAKDTTRNFKFLRIDRYRSVNKEKFTAYYQYLIEDYCREIGISPKKSCLYGKAEVFLEAAKKYQLDPVYLVSQTFLESAYGTSRLASGNVIKKIAYPDFRRTSSGKFKTKKLKTKVKVYNLYGIKAYDADPFVGGTSYAYYKKWTTVKRAIYGAASYLRSNYIHGSYRQNTIFKMRFTFRKTLWHQYATSPAYAENIGYRMYLMSSCYAKSAKFVYDYPKYR